MIFTARVLTPQEAYSQYQLVNYYVEGNNNNNSDNVSNVDFSFEKCLSIAREIIPNGPIALKVAKIAINQGLYTYIHTYIHTYMYSKL